MSLNGVVAVILHYFVEFNSLGGNYVKVVEVIPVRVCFLDYCIKFACVRHVFESTQFFGIAELLEILGR